MTARKCEICNTYGGKTEGSMSMVYGVRALCHPCIENAKAVVVC